MIKTISLCIAGFGNVTKEFCRLLSVKQDELAEQFGRRIMIVGVSRSKGCLVNNNGIDTASLQKEMDFAAHKDYRSFGTLDMLESCEADVFIELSPLSIKDGQPAISHIEKAFSRKMNVITANKGPIAWNYNNLMEKAMLNGVTFLYETTVMDGTPIFNLFKHTLHGNKINKITGILNGTSNYVLSRLEDGADFNSAIREAQQMGLAEADYSMDIDGWDGTAKICALTNVLMDGHVNPDMVSRKSIKDITPAEIELAKKEGKRYKYICESIKEEDGTIQLSVCPKIIGLDNPFALVNGTSAAVKLFTDLAGELTIFQTNPGILETAYGVYSDLLTILKTAL